MLLSSYGDTMPNEADQMLTIYLPQDAPDRATVRTALAELSQAHGLGRGPGALLVALATGKLTLIPASGHDPEALLAALAASKLVLVPTEETTPPANLVDLLEHCATLLQMAYPNYAKELRQRAKLLGEAGL